MQALDPHDHPCVLHRFHSPRPWATHSHHVVPQAWTDAAGMPKSRTVPLCPTGHDALHRALQAILEKREPAHRVGDVGLALIGEAMAWALTHDVDRETLVTLNAELA